MTDSGVKYLAVTCASESEALTLVYLAVCMHLLDRQLPARISPISTRSADIAWPKHLDERLIQMKHPHITIVNIQEFTLAVDDRLPDPEKIRTDVLTKLRAILAT